MAIEKVRELGQALRERIGRVIIGQEEADPSDDGGL